MRAEPLVVAESAGVPRRPQGRFRTGGELEGCTRPEAPATSGPALRLQERPGEIHSPEKWVAFLSLYFYLFFFFV